MANQGRPNFNFTLTPELAASIERMRLNLLPQVEAMADMQRSLSVAIEPLTQQFRATFAVMEPSLNLFANRMAEFNAGLSPALESFARSQRQIAEAIAPTMPALDALSAHLREVMGGIDMSAFRESVQAIIDLDDDELAQMIADLDDEERQPVDLATGDELADWIEIRKVMGVFLGIVFGLKYVELHLTNLQLAFLFDVIMGATAGGRKVYKFVAGDEKD